MRTNNAIAISAHNTNNDAFVAAFGMGVSIIIALINQLLRLI